jgi:hypothetical protein
MDRSSLAAATAIMLAACSEEAPPQQQPQQRAALAPGEYEANWTVTEVRSTDKTEPASELTVGATGTTRGCVVQGPVIDPALFAESEDECTSTSSYARGGRISIQMECSRPDQPGPVMQSVNATSAAEAFEGEVSTSTYFSGFGDYSMIRTITGRRLGDCPAEADAAQGKAAQ